jgi:processive 1,2-diacylglycerol beta-glucosyltransferase
MKVLILSVTAGFGHNAAANAVSESLKSRGAEVLVVDMFKYASKTHYDTVDKGYLFSTKYIPKPYGQLYSALEKNPTLRRRIISMIVTELITHKFAVFIEDFAPDAIVCTHVFSAMVLDELKARNKLDAPVISILTDYTFHPFWDDLPFIEHIVTGSPLLSRMASKKGIPTEKLLPFGIPIHSKFNTSMSRVDARAKLDIDPNMFTVLYMSGSMGFGHITKHIKNLDNMKEEMQILCVCGNNEKAYNKLKKMDLKKNISIYGFVNNVDLFMDAADCIVTKPGGLTITECVHKKLPMIFSDAIPGQEVRNAEFFVNLGAAQICTRHFSVDDAIYLLYHSPARQVQMSEILSSIAPEDPTGKLASFIENLCGGAIKAT